MAMTQVPKLEVPTIYEVYVRPMYGDNSKAIDKSDNLRLK